MAAAWSIQELETLAINAHRGAKTCTEIINAQFHRGRSVAAVAKQASRYGISLIEHYTCPSCGRIVASVEENTGYCLECHLHSVYMRNADKNTELLKELNASSETIAPKAHQLQLAYNAMRQKNSRLRKKIHDEKVRLNVKPQ